MKNIIFINGYNNYYNRRVKYSQDLNDYIDNYDCFIKEAINFNPNDGVKAIMTANLSTQITDASPDYALLVNEYNEIESRWFVIELTRNRNGQYNVQLKRDVIADHFDDLKELPIFVHKANLNVDNPLIFNNEDMLFNQIKTSEILLKDETDTNWIVGYILKDAIGESKTFTANPVINAPNIEDFNIELIDDQRPELGGKINFTDTVNIFTGADTGGNYFFNFGTSYVLSTDSLVPLSRQHESSEWESWVFKGRASLNQTDQLIDQWHSVAANYKTELKNGIDTYFDVKGRKVVSLKDFNELEGLNHQIVYSTQTGKYYRLSVGGRKTYSYSEDIDPDVDSDIRLFNTCNTIANEVLTINNVFTKRTNEKDEWFEIRYQLVRVEITLSETAGPGEISVSLVPGHRHTQDAIYDIFCIPFTEENLTLAQAISEELGRENVLDLQLLPYCPCRNLMPQGGGTIDLSLGSENLDYFPIRQLVAEEEYTIIDYFYFTTSCNGYFSIQLDTPIAAATDPVELKIQNQCDMYRLCSPNYNGVFEFNVAKNNGVSFFNVSFTYKPYAPYIQVAPAFSGLYGQEFRDGRGLICNGDFSLATLTDQWKTYEINNKNYENIFNTQIKTMDKNNQMNLLSQGITAPLNAAATGATVGALGGGVVGSIAAAASLVGGIADIAIGQSTYQNNRQLQKDLYNYNLQNVKARPDTVNKISAYNINNKYFPFIEYYTCTDTEKNALKNKIKYEGMTVMTIGTIDEYIGAAEDFNYFKGQLIQTGSIQEDYHIIDAIAVELERGIYLPGGNN